MPLEEIKLGGLAALEADEQVESSQALDATNCYIDDRAIRGRNGYRNVGGGPVASGLAQGIWRFRPGPTTARTVVAQNGSLYLVTDPSSETASDGVGSLLGAIYGSSANVSAAQLGKYLYVASDEAAVIWRRINPSLALENLTPLAPAAVAPTSTPAALAITTFTSLGGAGGATVNGGVTVVANAITDWYTCSGTVTGWVEWPVKSGGAAQDWSGYRWLFVVCSPETQSAGGGTFSVDLVDAAGNFASLATISDTPGDGAPFCAYLSLLSLPSGVDRTQIKYIRFVQKGPTTDAFCVYGFMPMASAPSVGTVNYYVSFYNSATRQESPLSPAIAVSYGSDRVTPPSFHAARWNYSSFIEVGTRTMDPDTLGPAELFNKNGGLTFPQRSELATTFTFTGAIPASSQNPNADTTRLWRDGNGGQVLVATQAIAGGQANYSVSDTIGDIALSHLAYKPTGTPPPCYAMTAVNGRLVAAGDPTNPNRVSISSYVPFSSQNAGQSDPFPQFPQIPQIAADGWAFDIAPTASEQVLWLGCGDHTLYILTNEACYVLANLDAPLAGTPPLYKVFERGASGRRAACWAEEALFWCGHDGIYMAENRASVRELSAPIRRLFQSWFSPDSAVVLGYQDRKLYALRGSQMLRYDFVSATWTRHTLAHSMSHADDWREPTGSLQRLWYLDASGNVWRWQPGLSPTDTNRATSDGGAAIPAWTYSTGFGLRMLYSFQTGYGDMKTRMRSVFVDAAGGGGTVTAYKDATTALGVSKAFAIGEHQVPLAPTYTAYKWRVALTAANGVSVRRLMWERPVVSGEGA